MRKTTKATVLIVDDDPAGQRLLSVRLRALGCEVETAGDGQKALASVQGDLPDMMLLDLEMPVMGGLELLRSLRRQRIELPVVVVTAYGSVETAVEAMKEGADDFITKPLDADHLEIVVRKVLEREELRQEKKILADEVGQRYQLIVGESARTKQAAGSTRARRDGGRRSRPQRCEEGGRRARPLGCARATRLRRTRGSCRRSANPRPACSAPCRNTCPGR